MAEHSVSQPVASVRASHLRRRWQLLFRQRMASVPLNQWRCVSIDIGKYEHVALIYDGQGELLSGPLRFGIRQADTQAFFAWVNRQVGSEASQPVFGMEPTGHYYEQLAYEIVQRYGVGQLYLIQSTDVARRRADWNQGAYKDDPVDGSVINELLRDGLGRPYSSASGPYLALYHLERYRLALEQASTRLKNQIIGHVDRLYPGLLIQHDELAKHYQALFRDLWEAKTPRHLLKLCPEPAQLRTQTAESLFDLFRQAGYWMTRPYAAKIVTAVQGLGQPEAVKAHWRSQFLVRDLARLTELEAQSAAVEAEMASYLDQTWGRFLTPSGVDPARLASLVAVVGDMRQYPSWRQLFGRSGLYSRRRDSGVHQRGGQGEHIVRAGDRHLRRQLMRFTLCMEARYPALRRYHAQLCQRGKHSISAHIAVARRLCGMLYTVATQEVPFDRKRYA
jgi:transposase